MKLKMYTVFDSTVEAYLQPFFMQSNGAAIRSFSDTVANPEHSFAKHPADYTLFEIGTFDDSTCEIKTLNANVNLGCAIEFVAQHDYPEILQK